MRFAFSEGTFGPSGHFTLTKRSHIMMVFSTRPVLPALAARREIDRLFDDVFGSPALPTRPWTPAVDVAETADAYSFTLDLPGFTADQMEITAEAGVLRIAGERTAPESSDTRWHVTERFRGRFERTFPLPQSADESGISATFAQGVLTVRVPKVAVATPRKIAIEQR
jgi:HSP20 family protein